MFDVSRKSTYHIFGIFICSIRQEQCLNVHIGQSHSIMVWSSVQLLKKYEEWILSLRYIWMEILENICNIFQSLLHLCFLFTFNFYAELDLFILSLTQFLMWLSLCFFFLSVFISLT